MLGWPRSLQPLSKTILRKGRSDTSTISNTHSKGLAMSGTEQSATARFFQKRTIWKTGTYVSPALDLRGPKK